MSRATIQEETHERLSRALAYLLAGTARQKQKAEREMRELLPGDIEATIEAYQAAITAKLADDIGEYVEERRAQVDEARVSANRRRPHLIRMSDVQPEPIRWLWHRYIVQGNLNLLVGDPGVSKSTVSIDITARVTRGARFPYGGGWREGKPADVVMLTAEDGIASAVHGRLTLAGADMKRVHILDGVARGTELEQFDLQDIPILEEAVDVTDAAMVVVDPVVAYMGDANTHRDSEIRRALRPIKALAEKRGITILGLMHLNKGEQRQAIYRVSGSIGFVGMARSTLFVVPDSEDEDRRVVGRVKGNLDKRPPDLAYRLIGDPVSSLARIEWTEELPAKTVESLIGGPAQIPGTEHSTPKLSAAIEFLEERLRGGKEPAMTLIQDAERLDISERTLRKAKERMRVHDSKSGGKWYWGLPAE